MVFEEKLNTIIQGDCLEEMKDIPDNSVDFAYADIPYCINKAEWDNEYPEGFEKEYLRIGKCIGITCGQLQIGKVINNLGNNYKGILSARNWNGMTFSQIGYGNWIPVIIAGTKIKRGMDAIEFVVRGDMPNHPSPKPIEFMKKIIRRFTEPNDTILDGFLGSGTTAVACIETGRNFIGIEINPEYCEIAEKRIKLAYEKKKQVEMFK